jgi:cytidine deaminase
MRTVERQNLAPWQQDLLAAAERASRTANCPYSRYPVGSAIRVRTRTGELVTVTGNNSETANYRSVCAEKHAVHRALADHSWTEDGRLHRPEILSVAVYCAVGATPQQPCGDCRETLHEIHPDAEVIAAAGPGRDGAHDPRVTVTTVRALLPHGFQVESLRGEIAGGGAEIRDSDVLEDYVLHLPRPADLATDAVRRAALLPGIRYLIVVGSPRRARRIAELAHRDFGARRDAGDCCYCDLTVPGRDETGREYAVYVPELPASGGGPGTRVAVASHGVGKAGVEIVLSELPALVTLAQDGERPDLRGVIRCGTRGTLSQVPLGCVALSTSCCNEDLERVLPSPHWLDRLRAAARERGMTAIADGEIDGRGPGDWPPAQRILAEGAGMSTSFFWEGQSRPLFRAGGDPPSAELAAVDRRRRAARLELWHRHGIRWIEMEDYTVLRIAEQSGIPAASLGAILGHRRRADGVYQGDYSKSALESELIPAELALTAIRADAAVPDLLRTRVNRGRCRSAP